MVNLIRDRLLTEKDAVIETALGKADQWAKSLRANRTGVMVEDMPKLLVALGLKVVDRNKVCVDKAVYEAYRTLATAAMSEPQKLVWEDEDK